jgi:hypothetical protein
MSFGSPAIVLGQAPPTLGTFDSVMNSLNTSPYFIGSMMLAMNLGARFLPLEVSKGQEAFLSHPWVRRFLIFVVFFIGTRNVWVAFWMALIVILLLGYLLNENSSLCLFKGGLPGSSCAPKAEVGTRSGVAKEGVAEGFVNTGCSRSLSQSPTGEGFANPLTAEEQEILAKLQAKAAKGSGVPPGPQIQTEKSLHELYQENLEKVKKVF